MASHETQTLVTETFRNLFAEDFVPLLPPDPEKHPATDLEFLDRLENDALSEEERAQFLRHLEHCPFCRHETADLIRTAVLYAEPKTKPVPGVQVTAKKKNLSRLISFAPHLLAAAVLLILAGTVFLFRMGTSRDDRLARRELSKLLTADDRAYSDRIPNYGYELTGNSFLKGFAFPTPHNESVMAAYQNALKAAPDDPNLRLDCARYQLCVLDLPADASETLKELATNENAPNRSQVLMTHGIALFKIGDDAEAQKMFRQVIEIDPASVDARLNLAVSLARTGETKEALKLFESVKDFPSVEKDLRQQIEDVIDTLKGKSDPAIEE